MAVNETPPFWFEKPGLQAWLLWPFSWIYSRGAAMKMHARPSGSVDVPVLCIGNFVAGGGGKTPTALAMAEQAIEGAAPRSAARQRSFTDFREVLDLPGLDAGVGFYAFRVEPDLAGAQQLLEVRVGKFGIAQSEPTVEAQAVFVVGDAQGGIRGLARIACGFFVGGLVCHANNIRPELSPAKRARIASDTEPMRYNAAAR